MKDILQIQIEKILRKRRDHRRYAGMLAILAMVTVLGVGWTLHSDGLSMTDSYLCGLEEHTHTDSCYTEELTCGQEESEEHEHTADCYSSVLTCDLPEHTHTEACLPSDDGETEDSAAAETPEEPGSDWDEYDSSDSSAVTAQNESNAVDMKQWLTDLSGEGTTYDKNGDVYSSNLKAEFEFPAGKVTSEALSYYYDYPAGIIVPDGLLDGTHNLLDESGNRAGTYHFKKNDDGTYRVYIDFDEKYADSHSDKITGFISFSGQIDASKGDEDGNIKIEGSDRVTLDIPKNEITYPDDATNSYDITTNKTGSYSAKDGELTYTVTVDSIKGTPGKVDFVDQITADGLTLGEPTVTVKKKTTTRYYLSAGGYTVNSPVDAGTVEIKPVYDSSTGKLTMTLPQMKTEKVKVEDGTVAYKLTYTSYEIEYTYKVSDMPKDFTGSVKNTVTTTSTDNKTTIKDSAEKDIKISNEYTIKKSGQPNVNENFIVWDITVNENNLDIVGAQLRDAMLKNRIEKDFTISPDKGWKWAYDENKKLIGIDFIDDGSGENRNAYTIRYRTPISSNWDGSNTEITNTAKFTPSGGKEIDSTGRVNVDGGPFVKKTFDDATVAADGQTANVKWTVTVTAPPDSIPVDTVITDDPNHDRYGSVGEPQYRTRQQVIEWADGISWVDANGNPVSNGKLSLTDGSIANVTFAASDGNTYTWQEINGNADSKFDSLTYTVCTVTFKQAVKPPEGASFLRFQYATTADLRTAEPGVVSYYKNSVQVGKNKTDASYPYQKEGVRKTDGNNQTGTTSVSSDGTLTWKVKVVINEENDKLTISDELPTGVTLTGLSGEDWLAQTHFTLNPDGTITGTGNYNQVGESSYKNNMVTVVLKPLTGSKLTAGTYTLVLNCKVDKGSIDGYQTGKTYTFTNTASASTDKKSLGNASQTQEWTEETKDQTVKTVSKAGQWVNDERRAKYKIELNPDGKDIVEDSEILTLKDVFTYQPQFYGQKWADDGRVEGSGFFNLNAYLVPDTVKLYKGVKNAKGTLDKGELITNWNWTVERKTNVGELNDSTSTLIGTNLPDSTPLIMEYEYQFESDMPAGYMARMDQALRNEAELLGTTYKDSNNQKDQNWSDQKTTGGVTSGNSGILYKVSKGSYGKTLPGAKFGLQKYDKSTNAFVDADVTYTTDEKGRITITPSDSYENNVLYRIVETEAPDGYITPSAEEVEANAFYFYFSSDDTAEVPGLTNYPDAANLSKTSATAYVENESRMTDITINKKWLDMEGNVSNSHNSGYVTVELWQRAERAQSGGGAATVSGEIMASGWGQVWNLWTIEEEEHPVGTEISFTIVSYAGAPEIKVNNKPLTPEVTKIDDWGGNSYKYTFTISGGKNVISGTVPDHYNNSFSGITAVEPDNTGSGDDSTAIPDKLYRTCTINANENWSKTISDLPAQDTAEDGSTVYYTYYIKELNSGSYKVSYDNNGGVASGTITVKNQTSDKPSYELPETGGSGTFGFAAAGAALMGAALLGGYNKKRRKRGMNS